MIQAGRYVIRSGSNWSFKGITPGTLWEPDDPITHFRESDPTAVLLTSLADEVVRLRELLREGLVFIPHQLAEQGDDHE
jgi:hypothetical protein